MPFFGVVDLGATSGRVVVVGIDDGAITLDPVHRFPTTAVAGAGGALTWDFDALLAEVRDGLLAAGRRAPLTSIAVDGWGVDYGLLDGAGARVGPVHAYRSARTDGVMDEVIAQLGHKRIYGITGIQFLPINTLYQLVAARDTADVSAANRLLMVPDLVNHELCGSTTNDVTNASTSQLLDVSTRRWSAELVDALDLPGRLLPDLHEPGASLGAVQHVGPQLDGTPVVAAASHDTAEHAVAGTPLHVGRDDIYVSCGTWSLVGCERPAPVTTAEALAANVTNELGVAGSVRLLKNVTGLWVLEECRRWWSAHTEASTTAELVAAAEHVPGGQRVIDPDDPRLSTPGDMPARIAAACRETGQDPPTTPPETVRTILDSLALAWRRTVRTIENVTGTEAATIHLVGGGSAIALLADLCASACERPVLAGPVEATVIGNAIVQAVAAGVIDDVTGGRELVRRSLTIDEVSPEKRLDWDGLEHRLYS